MEQVPTPMTVTVIPATVQTPGVVEAKFTGSPELAVAVIVNGAIPKLTSLRAANAIAFVVEESVNKAETLYPLLSHAVTVTGNEPVAEVIPYISQAAASMTRPVGNNPAAEHHNGGVPPDVPMEA